MYILGKADAKGAGLSKAAERRFRKWRGKKSAGAYFTGIEPAFASSS
jgi:hypothetical protein